MLSHLYEKERRWKSETRYCRFCGAAQVVSGDDFYHDSRVTCRRCYHSWPGRGWLEEPKPSAPPVGAEEEGGRFDCPQCQQEKVVHVNGGAWCMACGVRWVSVEAFRLDLKTYEAQQAHQQGRNFEALVKAAGSEAAARWGLEMEEVYKLQKEAIVIFNRVLDTAGVEDLKAVIALLQDFEMDTPK